MVESKRKLAYFSMEIALESDIPTYSGGLGVLAGDTLRSCADLEIPVVGITLAYNNGYFYQMLDYHGNQIERDIRWEFSDQFKKAPVTVKLNIQGKDVLVGAWVYEIMGITSHIVPVYLLDTNIEGNEDWQKNFTRVLYDATPFQRIAQEIILGIGGVRMLDALGYQDLETYHMNEGHAAFLSLELLKRFKGNIQDTRKKTVFTTHTPVPAGHDRFPYDLVYDVFKNGLIPSNIKDLAGQNNLNMTRLALSFSRYVNAVSKKHMDVAQKMFPGYEIDGITNGIHLRTWINPILAEFYEMNFPNWQFKQSVFEHSYQFDDNELWRLHQLCKRALLDYQKSHSWVLLNENILTIGFSRRMALYKRANLILNDLDKLGKICKNKAQFIFAGKAHPRDDQAKQLIKDLFDASVYLWDNYKVGLTFLENYDMDLSKLLVSGCDVWLNTPKRYMEASGTSGMKAAYNGVLNFSVLDGWWLEGYAISGGMAGWKIGPGPDDPEAEINDDDADAAELYDKLENRIIPTYYYDREEWVNRMKHAIRLIAYFNTNRMVREYADRAWQLEVQPRWKTKEK